jgi:damage-control phosphatase, subfamily I
MLMSERCCECLLGRIEYECRLVTGDETVVRKTVEDCRRMLAEKRDQPGPAPEISSGLHRHACDMISNTDPYKKIKEMNNKDALELEKKIEGNLTSLHDYCLAASIGNTLDYGSLEHEVTADLHEFFEKEFSKGFTVESITDFEPLCRNVVYLCDNSGEIVFDRLLIKYLKKKGARVVVVVRRNPIINDATMKDATELGLDKIANKLLTNTDGPAELGINLSLIPSELREEIGNADLIISKGMANYESLSELKKTHKLPPVAYLMMVKCEPIAEDIGIPKGSRIAYFVK